MQCPFCDHSGTRVFNSRASDEGRAIRRRRECERCGRRFTTHETIELQPLIVIKKDGCREEFSRDKLLRGLVRACEKCSVPITKLEALVLEIENILKDRNTIEVLSKDIGEMVMERLIKIDEIAYVRFGCVYRQFKDVTFFLNELEVLLDKSRKV